MDVLGGICVRLLYARPVFLTTLCTLGSGNFSKSRLLPMFCSGKKIFFCLSNVRGRKKMHYRKEKKNKTKRNTEQEKKKK